MKASLSGTGSTIAPSGAYAGSLKNSKVPRLTVEQTNFLQLNLTEKGLRKMMEMSKSYRHALLNADVLETFKVLLSSLPQLRQIVRAQSPVHARAETSCIALNPVCRQILTEVREAAMQGICAKARKLPKQSAELKDDLEAFETRLDADAAEVAEEHEAARAARKQVLHACSVSGRVGKCTVVINRLTFLLHAACRMSESGQRAACRMGE